MEQAVTRKSFVLRLKEGNQEEYRARHQNIRAEMAEMLKQAGIANYTIWLYDGLAFGYYETQNPAFTEAFKKNSPVQTRWIASMTELTECLPDGGMDIRQPECVFLLE